MLVPGVLVPAYALIFLAVGPFNLHVWALIGACYGAACGYTFRWLAKRCGYGVGEDLYYP